MQAQHPDIVSGFKHNILPQLPIPNVTPQIQLPPPQTQEIIDNVILAAPIVAASTMSICGFELQKKYVYIFLVLFIGLIIFFAYKWYMTPTKKNKKTKQQKTKDDSESEETEEDNNKDDEDDSDEEIPIYKK